MNGPATHVEVDPVERAQSAELHHDLADPEQALAAIARAHQRLASRALRVDDRMGAHPARTHRADELLEEVDNAVGQVLDDEEDHQAEDGQLEICDSLEQE